MGGAVGTAHQGHELRLQISWKTGEGRGCHINGRNDAALAADPEACGLLRNLQTGFLQHIKGGLQQVRPRPLQQYIAASHGHRHGIGAGFDPVGQNLVMCPAQTPHTRDFNPALTRTADFCAHFIEAQGQIDHFGLAGRIFNHRIAIGQTGGHHGRMRAADRDFRKADQPALQAFGGAGDHIATVDINVSPERFKRHDQQIDRTRADGATAGQRDPRLAHTGQKRRDHPETGAHPRDQFIRGGGIDNIACGQGNAVALAFALIDPFAADPCIHPVIADDAHQQTHIRQARHVIEGQGLARQQAGNHQGQSGIFGPADHNGAIERLAAGNADAIHC